MNDVMEDARAVIESSCNKPVVIMGMSKTGPVAIDLAVTYPNLVEKIVLKVPGLPQRFDLTRMEGQERVIGEQWIPRAKMILSQGEEKALGIKQFCELFYSEPGCQELLELMFNRLMTYPFGVLRTQFGGPLKEQMHLLPTITKPVLILQGEADLLRPLASAQYLSKQLPNASLYILKNRGHCMPFTATVEVGSIIRDFLGEDQSGNL
jgi:pimeloyl-ACP methyl ester carboxylesterase